ncbi:hypothetical protein DUNSADRAFT_16238, partial [Dunaliella salina]
RACPCLEHKHLINLFAVKTFRDVQWAGLACFYHPPCVRAFLKQGSFPEDKMATLLSLPDELLGHIFSMLKPRGGHCQRAFFSCCKTLRTSHAVHAQFSTLTISTGQLQPGRDTSQQSSNPFLCFPRGAHLKKLVLQEDQGAWAPDAGNLLLRLLQPTSTNAAYLRVVSVLQDVEEIEIEGYFPMKDVEAPLLGMILCCLSHVRRIKIGTFFSMCNPFLLAMASPCGTREELEIVDGEEGSDFYVEMPESLETISKLQGLRILSLTIPCLAWEDAEEDASALIQFSGLSQLEHLSISTGDIRCASRSITGDISGLLLNLSHLKYLSVAGILTGAELTALPASIERLRMYLEVDAWTLCDAVVKFMSHVDHLPKLSYVDVGCLDCRDLHSFMQSFSRSEALPQCLLVSQARVQISLEAASEVKNFDDFFSFCTHFSTLTRSIEQIWRVELRDLGGSADVCAANLKQLASACPDLKEFSIKTPSLSPRDLACLHAAGLLSNLKKLVLACPRDSQPGIISSSGLLALGVALQTKKGCPLTVVLDVWVRGEMRGPILTEFRQLKQQWDSVSESLMASLSFCRKVLLDLFL